MCESLDGVRHEAVAVRHALVRAQVACCRHGKIVRKQSKPSGTRYRLRMDTTHCTADQVRIPRVGEGEAVIVTRHGKEVAAIIAIEDFRLLESLKAAIAAVSRPPRYQPSAAEIEAWETDDDDEFPTDEEFERMLDGR